MLHHESSSGRGVPGFAAPPTQNLSMIAYRSIAASQPSDAALQHLGHASQARNRAVGLTGVLVHDRGAYFQWLEGPAESLHCVWNSILRDPRHHHVTILREERISDRVFQGWDLRIARGTQISIDATVAAMESSSVQLRRVLGRRASPTHNSLEDALAAIVVSRLRDVGGRSEKKRVPFASTASIWHADANAGEKFANALITSHAADAGEFVDSLLEQGANFNALYQEVFEPAQLQLGKLWDQDVCDDFRLTLGLARLHMQVRRVNALLPTHHLCKAQHSVLMSPQLREPHSLGLIMSSEVFARSGWDVICNMPGDDHALIELLRTQWFDVLKLSQSGALRRDSQLSSIRATIDTARAASLNRSLVVMVDGRTFSERPQVYRSVHADAMSFSTLAAVTLAERLVDSTRTLSPDFTASAS